MGTASRQMSKTLASRIYTYVVGLAFLWAGFEALPQYWLVIGLGYLAFTAAVALIMDYAYALFLAGNRTDDLAERKTRHAILLAPDPHRPRGLDDMEFWREVDARVKDELSYAPTDDQRSTPGRTLGFMALFVFEGILMVGAALLLSSFF
jgi:hypothetical protein